MRKILLLGLLAVLSLGCAITDYPVIFDTRGADANAVMQSFYDKAYIVPSGQVATIWSDGSDELYTEVVQDWKADQVLYTFNNFDASGVINFLDQTYCDPVRQDNCAIATAQNPDLPTDDPFDYALDFGCAGSRSLSVLVSYGSRIGECGSGVWSDKQGAALEFSQLERVNFRGREYYHLPIDSSVASFSMNGTAMPIYGRFNGYIDEQLRMALPITPNAKYQLRWLGNFIANNGSQINVDMTYGALTANFNINVTTVANALDRL